MINENVILFLASIGLIGLVMVLIKIISVVIKDLLYDYIITVVERTFKIKRKEY